MKTIAVLMATFNGGKFVQRQLDSILSQVDVHLEIFISDDCSVDDTLVIITDYANRFEQVHLVGSGLKKGGAAENFFFLIRSVDFSGFDYVAFSDQDDVWFTDKLIRAVSSLVREGVNGYSSDVIAYWPRTEKRKVITKSSAQTEFDFWFESPGPGCTHLFTSWSLAKFKKFICANEQALTQIDYHDWLVYAYYRYHDLGWFIDRSSHMLYVQHSENQIGANFGVGAALRRFKLIMTRWFRNQVNYTFRLVSGSETDLISLSFVLKNATRLRRKVIHSLLIAGLFVVGIL